MKHRSAMAVMLTLMVASFLAGIHNAEAKGTPILHVHPALSIEPGTQFSVDIVLANVTNLVGWEFKLFWGNSILECVADVVHVPTAHNWEAPNNVELGPGIEQDYNATNGRYYKALVPLPEALPHPTPFNGTTILVTLTFNVTAEGGCILDLRDTKLADYDASPISHKTGDGYFHSSQPRETWLYLGLCAHFFGVTMGDPRWNPSVDINVDGTIDVYDIVLIAEEFGENA